MKVVDRDREAVKKKAKRTEIMEKKVDTQQQIPEERNRGNIRRKRIKESPCVVKIKPAKCIGYIN